MARKSVTIRDVARHAGVSVATASRALNGKDVVNPQTRDRILSVMEQLGFSPSPAARRLSLGRTLTVGVVVSFLTRPQAAERLPPLSAGAPQPTSQRWDAPIATILTVLVSC